MFAMFVAHEMHTHLYIQIKNAVFIRGKGGVMVCSNSEFSFLMNYPLRINFDEQKYDSRNAGDNFS